MDTTNICNNTNGKMVPENRVLFGKSLPDVKTEIKIVNPSDQSTSIIKWKWTIQTSKGRNLKGSSESSQKKDEMTKNNSELSVLGSVVSNHRDKDDICFDCLDKVKALKYTTECISNEARYGLYGCNACVEAYRMNRRLSEEQFSEFSDICKRADIEEFSISKKIPQDNYGEESNKFHDLYNNLLNKQLITQPEVTTVTKLMKKVNERLEFNYDDPYDNNCIRFGNVGQSSPIERYRDNYRENVPSNSSVGFCNYFAAQLTMLYLHVDIDDIEPFTDFIIQKWNLLSDSEQKEYGNNAEKERGIRNVDNE